MAELAVAAQPTNVLFLICDDLNCDIGSYGHPQVKTPNMDRLAQRGVRFENAYCQYPLCGPSRASFMTGMYPDQTLVTRNAIYIREHVPNVKTIAQMFRDANYTATRVGKIFHYNVPLHIGTSGHDDPYSWDYTVNPRGRDRNEHDKITSLVPGSFGGTLSWLAADGDDSEQTDGIAAAEAQRVLKQHAADQTPFFLAVGLFRPHTPYVAPKRYFEMYPIDEIQIPKVPDDYLETIPPAAGKTVAGRKNQWNLDPNLARQAIQAYYASITFADAQLGHVLETLEQTGLDQNTVVVFTSDHGYHMGEHGHYQKLTLFENATRVPLIFAGPGIAKGETSASMAEMVDFYPTLAELTSLQAPASVSGISLAATLADPSKATRTSALSQLNDGFSLRVADYRYTEWGDEAKGGRELYDVRSDPAEMHNLANDAQHADVVNRLSKQLRDRMQSSQTPPKGLKQIRFENVRREKK
ncbi:Choline-sulfatase [Rubripirellula lacrimiformis]|uniref:Choline-sulfatase n=1 Tax=Rubripirellula lacrimiformis TaxID=1930273 RepID=A0A517NL28_9BACT|nr:sulfatase [Rubripirellula lacrimiformis]QDT07848.1 Choline-sulfatase [Rubripirellula lacrimiformis]